MPYNYRPGAVWSVGFDAKDDGGIPLDPKKEKDLWRFWSSDAKGDVVFAIKFR